LAGFARGYCAGESQVRFLTPLHGGGEEERVMDCPKCGNEGDLYEMDTAAGRDMRTYVCRALAGAVRRVGEERRECSAEEKQALRNAH
jgi:hypothetical protein